MAGEFSLTGHVIKTDAGKYLAKIELSTPDGRKTTLEAPEPYETEQEANETMKFNLDRILDDFTANHKVEVVSKTTELK